MQFRLSLSVWCNPDFHPASGNPHDSACWVLKLEVCTSTPIPTCLCKIMEIRKLHVSFLVHIFALYLLGVYLWMFVMKDIKFTWCIKCTIYHHKQMISQLFLLIYSANRKSHFRMTQYFLIILINVMSVYCFVFRI